MPRAINKCPQCGEPVTPFAAGCAICGADLEAARRRRAARREIAVPGTGLLRQRVRLDWPHVLIAAGLALAVPPVGFLLALYWARQRHNAGEPAMVAVMLAAAVLAAAAFFAPVWFWSHVLNL